MKNILYTLLLSTSLITTVFAQVSNKDEVVIGEVSSIYSNTLGEERRYQIYLPPSHKDSTLTEKYPVLFVLDGDWYFSMISGMIEYSKGAFKLPEMIVVGISSVDRIRDFTPSKSNLNMFGEAINGLENSGGGEQFIRFLQDELLPHIESNYRATGYKILAGHSFGGLLANHIFTTNNQLFNTYLLIDPSLWWNNENSISQTKAFLEKEIDLKSTLFFGQADDETRNNKPHIEALNDYKKIFKLYSSKHLRSKFKLFEKETHASVGLPSIYYGLSYIFEGYRPADSTFQDVELLSQHYAELSRKYRFRMLPPEGLVRNLGWGKQYGEKDISQAIPFFQLNVKNYPKSANASKVLAEAYEMNNQMKEALFHYRGVLEINPNDDAIKEKIKKIQNE